MTVDDPKEPGAAGGLPAGGGWEAWTWDESLFAGAAEYYEQGRLPYAPGLADVFARSLALDGRGRLLDVGCGPGTVTLRLAPLFEAVVGVDPDAEMLAQASRAARWCRWTRPATRARELTPASGETGGARSRSRRRPMTPSMGSAVGTWAAAVGPGAASATPRPTARTRCSSGPASCPPRR